MTNQPSFPPFRGIFGLLAALSLGICSMILSSAQESPVAAGGLLVAKDGVAQTTIHVLPVNNEEMSQTAKVLSQTLEKMSGVAIPVATEPWKGDGILLALKADLPESESPLAGSLKSLPAEAYGMEISSKRAVLSANSPKALRDGVYALLEQMGCRWLLPSERWTVIPKQTEVRLPVQKIIGNPDYRYRSIWYAYGIGNMGPTISQALDAAYDTWCDANQLGGVTKYKIGHTYGSTVGKHQSEFEAHPEYFAMNKDGTRRPFSQFQSLCYSNPAVAKFFIEDKHAELEADKKENPNAHVVSMDPNDGTVECFCKECQKLGNGTDQALYLANQVARSLRQDDPDAVVTMYAYASHRLPPEKVKAEPNIQIEIATGFNKTKYTLEQLVALWRKKVDSVGIRDYFGVMAWDWGLPGRGRSSSFEYVKTNIPRYYNWGARAFNAETNANWGTFGPATYLATKLLWNVHADADAIYADYFSRAFGKASGDMKVLYNLFGENQDLSRTNIHRWLSQLDKAFESAKGEDGGVANRLTDLAAYLHYVVLYRNWKLALDMDNQDKAYEALRPLLEFTWRIRDRNMVHAYALERRLVNTGDPKLRPLREGWRFNEPNAVWKNPNLLTDPEILEIFRKDLAENPPDDRIVEFSHELSPLGGPIGEKEPQGNIRFESIWHVLVENNSQLEFKLPMVGVKGDYELEIFDATGASVWESTASVEETESRYAQKPFEMEVRFPAFGQYKLVFSAGEDYAPHFPPDLKAVLEVGPSNAPLIRMFGPTYFYVPKGAKQILVKTDGRFSVIRPGAPNRTDYTSKDDDSKLDCLVIPVEGADGQYWTMGPQTTGRIHFLNIPPYIATDPGRLLIPKGMDSKSKSAVK